MKVKVRRREPIEYYAVQMEVKGVIIGWVGKYKYRKGDWLLCTWEKEADKIDPKTEFLYAEIDYIESNLNDYVIINN